MNIEKLTTSEIQVGLKDLPGWELKAGKLHRELKFKDFVQAFGFMTQAAILAQQMDHHPEWSNVYSRVTIDLATHTVDGISQNDLELAGKINELLANMIF